MLLFRIRNEWHKYELRMPQRDLLLQSLTWYSLHPGNSTPTRDNELQHEDCIGGDAKFLAPFPSHPIVNQQPSPGLNPGQLDYCSPFLKWCR